MEDVEDGDGVGSDFVVGPGVMSEELALFVVGPGVKSEELWFFVVESSMKSEELWLFVVDAVEERSEDEVRVEGGEVGSVPKAFSM